MPQQPNTVDMPIVDQSKHPVTLDIVDNIAIVTLNRPDKHNALNMDMFKAIDKVSGKLRKNKHIRAVIVQGSGVDFCTGLDIKSILTKPLSGLKLLWKWFPGSSNLAQRVSTNWRKIPVPVIMSIHGRCWGGGLQIALGADFRICTPDSTLSVMEAKWGLIPDMGGTVGMREIVPLDKALDFAMTAREITAQEALECHLITEISDNPKERSLALAKQIAENSPDAVAKIKRVFHKSWHNNDWATLARESFWQWFMLLGKNQRIAVKRHSGKSDTPYKPRS
ncbi:crotonase/enoyl-CoA hydratase family protein [Paraneptunicella aestuarii]|uniref:crotonase/enoyl-CoA hydratase family protein n=1 Tax=Paraneptunicella aestuarii TaxID=2831148 RepID=UPI001E330764|nr:crotonase/enoyl-CoA hydratase family protein [Paraneptunicella aestuarii]